MNEPPRHQWLVPADLGALRAVLLCRTFASFALLLLAFTWRLWTPRDVFPQVPLLAVGNAIPFFVDWIALAAAVLGLLIVIVAAARPTPLTSIGLAVFTASMLLLFVTDQHRLQPWAYQFVILALLFAVLTPRGAVGWARLLCISIYAWSAISKLDVTFTDVLGRTFLDQLLSFAGLTSETWPTAARRLTALGFPLGELAVAVLLAVPRLRRVGVLLAIVMHVLLLLILGPLGLDHWPGVLLWNCFFVVFIPALFLDMSPRWLSRLVPRSSTATIDANVPARRANPLLAMSVYWMMTAVVLLPALESSGYWDHWPSWGLYASRNEQVQVFLSPSVLERLPPDVARHVSESDTDWSRLRIDRWSLESLGAPLYPQARYQLGVAQAVASQWNLDRRIRVVHRGTAARISGERTDNELHGRFEIERMAGGYWLNARPRPSRTSRQRADAPE